jgi:hypothetical protein
VAFGRDFAYCRWWRCTAPAPYCAARGASAYQDGQRAKQQRSKEGTPDLGYGLAILHPLLPSIQTNFPLSSNGAA